MRKEIMKSNFYGKMVIMTAVFLLTTLSAVAQDIRIHVVSEGETIATISKKYSVTKETILQINPEASRGIFPGMELQLPDKNSSGGNNYGEYDANQGYQADGYTTSENSAEYSSEYMKYVGKGLMADVGIGKFSHKNGGSKDYSSYSVGFAFSALFGEKSPLYFESHYNIIYTYNKEEEYGCTSKLTMISSNIPVNIGCIIAIPNTNFALCPYAGLSGKFHFYGKLKEEYGGESESWDVFSERDMGKDDKFENMQLAWQAGLKLCFRGNSTAFVKFSYGEDLTDLGPKMRMKQFDFAIGCYF